MSAGPELKVLFIEDNQRDVILMSALLERAGYRVVCDSVDAAETLQKRLERPDYEIIISDYNLRGWTAIDALEIVKKSGKDIPVVVVSGNLGDEAAAACIKEGGTDYVLKDRMARLPSTVERALTEKRVRAEQRRAEKERKYAELALRESEERYRTLVEAVPQLVWTSTSDGRCDYLSQQWVNYTGIPAAEQLGYAWLERLHPDDREAVTERWAASVERGAIYDSEFRIRRSDGVYRWFKTRAIALRDENGQIMKWFGTNTDIEDYKSAEAELRRSNDDLKQFGWAASHDLQEPLRMVTTFTQLLEKRYGDQLGQDGREYIRHAVEGASRIEVLLGDLRTYWQVSERAHASPKLIDLGLVLREAMSNLRTSIETADAEIVADSLPVVWGELTPLVQLLQDLLSNAIKYRSPNRPPRVRLSAKRMDNQWLIRVEDNGIGIKPEYSELVFGLFKRLHGRQDYPGTGIGLAICQKIVERYRGKIWFESVPGEGTAFCFTVSAQS